MTINIYGFTGTRNGLNDSQKKQIIDLLKNDLDNGKIIEVHYGDCIGADTDFHNICNNLSSNIKIIIHPPNIYTIRSFCKSNYIHQPKAYLDRNKNIVDSCNILIGCPMNEQEILRSGTWSTIRYAKKNK
jgi:hypothetical protein